MAKVILITGGSRSGKSAYAQKLAERLPGPRAYVATCPIVDAEMQERVKKHQQERGGQQWDTIEETTALRGVLNDADKYQVMLVDCLTLWVSNLMYEAEQQGCRLAEEKIECLCRDILAACRDRSGTVILVTNEVGMGIVPENEVARRFRDLAGRCNQDMAAGADEVILIACGLPLHLKGVE